MSEVKREVWIVEWHDGLGKGNLAGYAFFSEEQAKRHIRQEQTEDDIRAKHGRARAFEGVTWTVTKSPRTVRPILRAGGGVDCL